MSIGAAFTGYLSQQNFDSQWISTQAKDGLNSVGIGALFNVLNFGQMLLWHVLLLPVVVGVLIGVHLLLVRRRGVVPPLPSPHRASCEHRHGTRPRRGLSVLGRSRPMSGAPPAEPTDPDAVRGGAPARRQRLGRPQDPLRPGQGVRGGLGGDRPRRRRPGGDLLLARRPSRHHPPVVPGRPRRLPGHVGHRARRVEPHRHLRPALQLVGLGRGPEDRARRTPALGRCPHPREHAERLRPGAPAPGCGQRPVPARRADPVHLGARSDQQRSGRPRTTRASGT